MPYPTNTINPNVSNTFEVMKIKIPIYKIILVLHMIKGKHITKINNKKTLKEHRYGRNLGNITLEPFTSLPADIPKKVPCDFLRIKSIGWIHQSRWVN